MKCIETLCIYLSSEQLSTELDQKHRKERIQQHFNERFVTKLTQMVEKQSSDPKIPKENSQVKATPVSKKADHYQIVDAPSPWMLETPEVKQKPGNLQLQETPTPVDFMLTRRFPKALRRNNKIE